MSQLYRIVLYTMSDHKGVVGLTNIGNTCYGNAILQALRHQVDLTIFFLQKKHSEILQRKTKSKASESDTLRNNLIERYSNLLQNMWASEKGVEPTRDFWSDMVKLAINKGFDEFRLPIPHDAHEFLGFILDQIHEGLGEQVEMTLHIDDSKKEVKSALEFWKKSFETTYSPLVEILFSLKRKSTVCNECKNESVTWETFNIIDVTVPEKNNESGEPYKLKDLFVSDGNIDELDDYDCGGECNSHSAEKRTRTKASVSRSIWRLGSWVIFALKRFKNNGQRINTLIDIPTETTFADAFTSHSVEPSKNHTYELFATVHHHGVARGGHYTARAKHPVTGKWNLYDDESTHELPGPSPIDPSVYIVMYRRMKSNTSAI